MPTPDSRPTPNSWLTTLGWAAYLACSWTWCIGMFLPVLLLRDFGLWGFIVFAVPNVIGAASVAFVIRTETQLSKIFERHGRTVALFSLVTRMFQLFFLTWLSLTVVAPSQTEASFPIFITVVAGLLICSFASALAMLIARSKPLAAGSIWALSAAIGAHLLLSGDFGQAWGMLQVVMEPRADVLWLAPVCLFGFLLCPYLDFTFLAVRGLNTRRSAIHAFSLGFGVLFPLMILMTLGYAGWLVPINALGKALLAGSIGAGLVLLHISIQLGATFGMHAMVTKRPPLTLPRKAEGWAQVLTVIAAVLSGTSLSYHGLALGEVTYRLFMSFYGLAFPAYVWLCMIPTRNEPSTQPPSRAKLIILFTAITLAAPFYWMGFIERQTWYLAPGLAIVLFARLAIPRSAPVPS